MLAKRIIPCLDVKNGRVVKGVQFKNHKDMGDISFFAKKYADEGADELVFYDITASSEGRVVDRNWIKKIAKLINIPFCVAGGIRSLNDAKIILNSGADKISINSPAIERPYFISELSETFGSQCVVVGVDSLKEDNNYFVYQYTGDIKKTIKSNFTTLDWVKKIESLGAGEIVLNCMNKDGMRSGFDINQLNEVQDSINIPLIASGGAGNLDHFSDLFKESKVSGALAASIFHSGDASIRELKVFLKNKNLEIRL